MHLHLIMYLPRSPLLYAHPHTLCQALDGFLIVLDSDGFILYVSDSITDVVGLTQVQTYHFSWYLLQFRLLLASVKL